MKAIFYGVGLGPGDPELITRKAQRVLQSVDWILHPASAGNGQSFSKKILAELGIAGEKLQEVSLCMGRDRTQALQAYRKAADGIAAKVSQGQSVAFVTEGDPFFYSTFIYVYEALRAHHAQIPVEIVPGISSVFQAASAAGLPTARQDERVAILPSLASEEELQRMHEDFDTLFLLKLPRSFPIAYKYLQSKGFLDQAVYLEKIGTSEERIERDLRKVDSKNLPYFAMLMIQKMRVQYTRFPISKDLEQEMGERV